jgi:hypothetical protein
VKINLTATLTGFKSGCKPKIGNNSITYLGFYLNIVLNYLIDRMLELGDPEGRSVWQQIKRAVEGATGT